MSAKVAALQARVEVLSCSPQEICRALPAAADVRHELSRRVASAGLTLEASEVNEARAAELAGLLDALGRAPT
jgi:hypothetical protein